MNYDLLFLDVDGTLKQEPYLISEQNKEAIKNACHAGKKISIATGRNKKLILNTVRELQLADYDNSYTVALNGAHIIDNLTGDTLRTVPISTRLAYQLFLKAYELDVSCHVYTENLVCFNYSDFHYNWYKKLGCDCRLADMGSSELGLEEEPLKFIVTCQDIEKLNTFHKEMHSATMYSLNAEFSSPYTLEYTSVHASKGLGMEYLCGLLGKSPSPAMPTEDGENDISIKKYLLL